MGFTLCKRELITRLAANISKIGALEVKQLGTEYILIEYGSSPNDNHRYDGYISLVNMGAGDTVVVSFYVKSQTSGVYKLFSENIISDIQPNPVFYMTPLPNDVGMKITIKQTAGIVRTFYYRLYAFS